MRTTTAPARSTNHTHNQLPAHRRSAASRRKSRNRPACEKLKDTSQTASPVQLWLQRHTSSWPPLLWLSCALSVPIYSLKHFSGHWSLGRSRLVQYRAFRCHVQAVCRVSLLSSTSEGTRLNKVPPRATNSAHSITIQDGRQTRRQRAVPKQLHTP